MLANKKIVAVVPAYNTARALTKTIPAIDRAVIDEILVIDDGSKDDTAEVARRLGARVISHPHNRGYGAAQKTGYAEAVRIGADVAVMVHSDFQYDPTLAGEMARPIAEGRADATFGSRMTDKKRAWRGGMHWWRFIPNIVLSWMEEKLFKLHLTEYHTGYRAFSKQVIQRVPFEKNSNNFVFDTETFAQLALGGFRVAEIPIPTRYAEDSSSMGFWKCCQYGTTTLVVMGQYILQRMGLKLYPKFAIHK